MVTRHRASGEPPVRRASGRARILAIDDSPTIIAYLRRVLEPEGLQVESLGLFRDLARRIKDDPPDLIVLDLNMPTIPGVPIGGLIRRLQPREIPIVVYSSLPRDEIEAAAARLGVAAIVQQGDPDRVLIEAVKAVLQVGCADRPVAPMTN